MKTFLKIPILVTFVIGLISCDSKLQEVYEVHKIESNNLKETLYLKKISRGLNYSAIYLSLKPGNKKPNEESDYIFRNLDTNIFYEIKTDTLKILSSSEVKIPKNNNFETTVIINKIKNNIEYIELDKTHKNLGLTKWNGELD